MSDTKKNVVVDNAIAQVLVNFAEIVDKGVTFTVAQATEAKNAMDTILEKAKVAMLEPSDNKAISMLQRVFGWMKSVAMTVWNAMKTIIGFLFGWMRPAKKAVETSAVAA